MILPFENSPSSAILTSIIWQLWSVDGGGALQLDVVDSLKSHNMQGGVGRDESEGEGNKELEPMEAPTDGIMTVLRPDSPLRDTAASLRRGEDTTVEVVDCGVDPDVDESVAVETKL